MEADRGTSRLARALAALGLVVVWAGLLPPASADHDDEIDCYTQPHTPRYVPPDPPPPATLRPARRTIDLDYQGTARVPVALEMPADPTPLDVFFLVDTTASMDGAICGVRVGLFSIARALVRAGIDVRFGVAEYRVYREFEGDSQSFPYRRVRDIGLMDGRLVDALYQLQAQGGGEETQLAAIYQSATGAGQDLAPRNSRRDRWRDIKPDRQANFRPDALKVILHVADERFTSPSPTYPVPSEEKVIAALRDRDVLQLGIAVAEPPYQALRRIAEGSRAVAPIGGVDCNGDGAPEIAQGQPLVCRAPPPEGIVGIGGEEQEIINMAPSIVALLKAVRDFAEVRVVPSNPTLVPRVRFLDGPRVDLKRDNRLGLTAIVSCRKAVGDRRLALEAVVRGETIASSTIRVRCGAPPLAFPSPPRAAAAVAPAPAPAPNPQPQPQANPNLASQPTGAFAPAVQQQPQVAVQQAFDDARLELEASSRRRYPSPAMTLAAGAILAAAFAPMFRTAHARAKQRGKR